MHLLPDAEQYKCREEFHRHLPSSHRFVADVDGGDKDGDGGDKDGDIYIMVKCLSVCHKSHYFCIQRI